MRDEFATSVNNAEEMREWKARAEKAEAEDALLRFLRVIVGVIIALAMVFFGAIALGRLVQ